MSKILVVGPSWVGDMVMSQSLFMALREQNPDCRISVLGPAWSLPILARMPEVEGAIEMPVGHGRVDLGARKRLAKEIRNMGFDRAIVLPGSLKSALVPWLAGIPRRTGYKGEQRYRLINDMRRLDKDRLPLSVQRFVALAGDSEPDTAPTVHHPRLAVSEDGIADACNALGLTRERPVTALCPGAEYGASKRWPAAYYAEVARAMLDQGRQVWLFGSKADHPVCEEINRLAGSGCTNLAGRTSLVQAVDLLSLASEVVTNDSGLMHVAAAVGRRVIAIYGSSSDGFTPPLTDHATRLSLGLDCSPCFRRECPYGHHNCMQFLRPGRVLEILEAA